MQWEAIYKKRHDILVAGGQPTQNEERPLKARVMEMLEGEVEQMVALHTAGEDQMQWEIDKIEQAVNMLFPEGMNMTDQLPKMEDGQKDGEGLIRLRTSLIEKIMQVVQETYKKFEEGVGDQVVLSEIEKAVLLRSIDDLWIEHLENMEYLRRGVNLQAYGQRDPLVEYKRESYRMFQELQAMIQRRVAQTIFKIRYSREVAEEEVKRDPIAEGAESGPAKELEQGMSSASGAAVLNAQPMTLETSMVKGEFKDVGRNDLCPCGSGKKYKKCHGA
jgi:preprotein translocase subunit SecA